MSYVQLLNTVEDALGSEETKESDRLKRITRMRRTLMTDVE